jgi:uncharacterized protein (TIGR02246 family)
MAARTPEEIHDLIAAAFNAGDLDAFMDLHEEGAAALVPPEGRLVTGTEALRAALAPIFDLEPEARIEVVGKVQGDELALTHARVSVVAGSGDQRLEVSGPGTIVSRRQPDGTWRIVLDNPMTPR